MRGRFAFVFTCSVLVGHYQPLHAAPNYPAHRGDSPWSFTAIAEPSSRFVVNDTDSDTIDVYLLRSQGPIVIDIPIRRYIGPTDASGHLLNLAELQARGIVSQNAIVTLPAYDVDDGTPGNSDCDADGIVDTLASEVDELFLNDEKVGILTGSNNRWLQNSFRIPMSTLRFPQHPGETATNRFRLDIDVANRNVVLSSGKVGCNRWAVAIDWIGLRYEASSPVVMVHGINSSGDTFKRFRLGLEREFVMATDLSITLNSPPAPEPIPPGCPDISYNRSIESSITQLRQQIPAIAERFGSETLHFVAHSKGGLDVRGFLSGALSDPVSVQVGSMGGQPVRRDLEGRSLVTLGTPHEGTVLAQYGVEARQLTRLQALAAGFNVFSAKLLEGGYYCDLTPARSRSFVSSTSIPANTHRASVGTDADCNGDGTFSYLTACPTGQGELDFFPYSAPVAKRLYELVGNFAAVGISVTPVVLGPDRIEVSLFPNSAFQRNDLFVSQASAAFYTPYDVTGWHHLNLQSPDNGAFIAADALAGGLVDWRKR